MKLYKPCIQLNQKRGLFFFFSSCGVAGFKIDGHLIDRKPKVSIKENKLYK